MRNLKNMNYRLVTIVFTLFILLSSSFISAETLDIETPTIWDKILRFFSEQSFTIVGQDNHASIYADETWYINSGSWFTKSKSETNSYCNGNSGLYNIFARLPGDNTWYSKFETIDSINVFCVGTNKDCPIELYCMPYDYPPTDSICNSWKAGSTAKIKTAVDPIMPLMSGSSFSNSYIYCSEGCTGTPIKCWRVNGAVCESREYSCGYETYPNCPSSWPFKGSTASNSGCQAAIPSCTPDSSCASNTCTGQTCSDSCGNNYQGTKSCGGTTPTCSDGIQNQGETGIDCGGPCSACPILDTGGIVVLEITLPEDSFALPNINRNFVVKLKNTATTTKTINVEAGFYTKSYAKDIAKLYSVFPLFSIEPIANCVENEPFVKSKKVTIDAGDTETVIISQKPLDALLTLDKGSYVINNLDIVAFLGVYETCCQKLSGFEGCVEGTGGYIDSKYDATFTLKDTSNFKKENILCDGEIYGVLDYKMASDDVLTITRNYNECIDYVFYTEEGEINETATEEYKQKVQGGAYSQLMKVSLTKEEISKATNTALLLSSCIESKECLPRENYTESCISIRSLRDDGVLTESKTNSFFDEAKVRINGGIMGGAIGGTVGILGCGATLIAAGVTAPATFGASIVGGAALCSTLILGGAGVGAGIGIAFTGIDSDDILIKELQAENDNAVGICTAEKEAFDLGGWIDKIGKTIKITGNETTDGFIILVGGFIILMIFLSMLGGRK